MNVFSQHARPQSSTTGRQFIVNVKLAKNLAFASGLIIASFTLSGITGCSNSANDKAIKNEEVKSVAKETPMSAAPAKTKDTPIAVGDDSQPNNHPAAATVDNASEGTIVEPSAPKITEPASNGKAGKGKNQKASAVAITEQADNSAMDSISENDQVIDDAPASPDAPQAHEAGNRATVQNEPVHKKK